MNKYNTIFSGAHILVPAFSADPGRMLRWAVIACDQFTSEPGYWEACEEIIGREASAYRYIMPEAWLGTPREASHGAVVMHSMETFDEEKMRGVDGYVFLERTLPNGRIRHGIVGRIDLEAYDYAPGSASPVRATEATVLERIPPRCKVRASASVELPHILILVDDRTGLFDTARHLAGTALYDFDLMQGGGHVRGYALEGMRAARMTEAIAAYEASRTGVIYAMGDGNHSLAAAKAHWENVKRETGRADHPARYALCEITGLGEDSLVFEPIYRLIKNCDPDDLMKELRTVCEDGGSGQRIEVIRGEKREVLSFRKPDHALTVGTLQNFLDDYIRRRPGTICDYIHGVSSLITLAKEDGCVGFLFDGMDKEALFPYVEAHGTLPRKTFSMGEAESKRYYLECRRIRE